MKKLTNLIATLILIAGLIHSKQSIAQSTTMSNSSTGGTEFLGWSSGTSKDLDIINQHVNKDITFQLGATPTLSMFIEGSTRRVGIGNFTGPVSLLDVDGDINIKTPGGGLTYAYKIDGTTVLTERFVAGSYSSLFVGFGAGAGGTGGGGFNTFVGYNAGLACGSNGESYNTFVGDQAGLNNDASENTFIGSLSGKANTTGDENAFLGRCSGRDNDDGEDNTFIGHWSASYNVDGKNNTAVGSYSLGGTTSTSSTYNVAIGDYTLMNTNNGDKNTSVGSNSGQTNINGDFNTYIGYKADALSTYTNLTNACAIGSNALVTTSNTMILGDTSVIRSFKKSN